MNCLTPFLLQIFKEASTEQKAGKKTTMLVDFHKMIPQSMTTLHTLTDKVFLLVLFPQQSIPPDDILNLCGTIIRSRSTTRHGCLEQRTELCVCISVAGASWRVASPGNAYLNCSVDKCGPRTNNERHTNWLSIALYAVTVTYHHQHVLKPFNGLPIGPSARNEGRQNYTAGKQKVAFTDEQFKNIQVN